MIKDTGKILLGFGLMAGMVFAAGLVFGVGVGLTVAQIIH